MRLPESDVFSLAVSPADGAVYAGTEPSRLFISRDGGRTWRELEALRQIPSAPTWSFPPRPWTSHVRWIAPSPDNPGLLLMGIEWGGLLEVRAMLPLYTIMHPTGFSERSGNALLLARALAGDYGARLIVL